MIVTCLYIYTEGETYTPGRTTRLRICVKETSYMLQQGVTEACTICVTCCYMYVMHFKKCFPVLIGIFQIVIVKDKNFVTT